MEDCPLPEGALACSEEYELEVQDDCSFSLKSSFKGCGIGRGKARFSNRDVFVGSGRFISDNTTFAMEQKVDPDTGNPSSFSVLIKNGQISCLARYNLSETAGFVQATDGGAEFDTNVTCQPGSQTFSMVKSSMTSNGGPKCEVAAADIACITNLELSVEADCSGTLSVVNASDACMAEKEPMKVNVSRIILGSNFEEGKDAFFITDPLADSGIMGGNTPKDSPMGQVWLSDGEDCDWYYNLKDDTRPLVTFVNDTAPGESPSPVVLPDSPPSPVPAPGKPPVSAAAAVGMLGGSAILTAAIMAMLLAAF